MRAMIIRWISEEPPTLRERRSTRTASSIPAISAGSTSEGNLRLAGRTKEMYIRGGYNVYPVEVENVLREHPKVSLVGVIAIPDPVLGERGKAFVVAADPADPPGIEELKTFVGARIADYKVPDIVEVREELPLTSMFKVDKSRLTGEQ
jgi:acyl-CoA synthetase (AMP-forming)/AMP-acid ligase II